MSVLLGKRKDPLGLGSSRFLESCILSFWADTSTLVSDVDVYLRERNNQEGLLSNFRKTARGMRK